jgi:three-Cys-motif partner protein
MNRNVLWRHPEKVSEIQKNRMNRFWGDESWRDIAYSSEQSLFGFEEKQDIETIAEAFRNRLIDKAGFRHVPQPIPMRNTKGTIVYYLFFASPKPVAMKIVKQIFDKYRNWRIEYVEDI